jgi:hypothetical protein
MRTLLLLLHHGAPAPREGISSQSGQRLMKRSEEEGKADWSLKVWVPGDAPTKSGIRSALKSLN